MDAAQVQLIAGSISSSLFATSTIPMLLKVFRTRDLRSYSLSYIVLSNVANAVHWLYVLSLPFGPIWLLHTFFTVTTLVLLISYLRYERSKTRP